MVATMRYSVALRDAWKKVTPAEYAEMHEAFGDHTAVSRNEFGEMLVSVFLSNDGNLATLLPSWIRDRGGQITARDLCRLRRDVGTSGEAEQMLMTLVDLQFGSWQGTRTSRKFVLHPVLDKTNTGEDK